MKKLLMTVWIKPIYQKIYEQAKPFLRTRKNLIHTRISLQLAIILLRHEIGDEEIVIPAILLHDVGWKMIPANLHLTAFGPNPSNPKLARVHEKEGAKIAENILKDLHYPSEKIKEICRIIEGHDSRKRPISLNDRIVKDADKLWRYSQRAIVIDIDRFNTSRLEHFSYLEGKIDQWFLTPTAKKMARQKISKRNTLLP